jgi:hypothetical protein
MLRPICAARSLNAPMWCQLGDLAAGGIEAETRRGQCGPERRSVTTAACPMPLIASMESRNQTV